MMTNHFYEDVAGYMRDIDVPIDGGAMKNLAEARIEERRGRPRRGGRREARSG